jgi:uncharacterized protein YecT (DUF1311 family)
MKRLSFLLCCAGALLQHSAALRAQEVLSFEPGGQEACAKARGGAAPIQGENPRTLAVECDDRDLAIEKTEFDALRRSMAKGSPEERIAFNALMVSFAEFRDAHAANETCVLGNGCGEAQKHEKVLANHDFLVIFHMGEGFTKDDFPSFSADELAKSDAELNAVYQSELALLPESCAENGECHSANSFRNTERTWIAYRDAWVTFGTLHWPQVTIDSWSTYLTRQRTNQIEHSFGISAPAAAPTPENHVN